MAVGSAIRDQRVLFWIAQSCALSAILPLTFDLLRMSLATPDASWRQMFKELLPWFLLLLPVLTLCQTPFLVRDVEFSASGFAKPVYGPGELLYVVYWLVALTLIAVRFTRNLKSSHGIVRAELGFTVLAFTVAASVGVAFAQVLPLLTGNRNANQFAPLSVVLFDCIVAYGIVTRRIMNVGDVIRRFTAYSLLMTYLVLLYMLVFASMNTICSLWLPLPGMFPHLLAALAVAFSMAPAHGRMQKVVDRLFINMQMINEREVQQQVNDIVMSIGTTHKLVTRFANVLKEATGTDRVTILLAADGGFSQAFPVPVAGAGLHLHTYDPLVTMLGNAREPVGVDVLRRMRVTGARLAALEHLQRLNTSIVVGIRAKGRLEGVLLLGPRISGRIYSAPEQDTLQMLCNEVGVALENAGLYTAVENSRIYNEILLDSLAGGVVAVGLDGTVTVFNKKAQTIMDIDPSKVIGHTVSVLPHPIVAALDATLSGRRRLRDEDAVLLRGSGETVPVRLSASVFHGHTEEQLGALVVINDMTQLKVLEEQVRRTDRLSSLGTLSAGIAHEIKNPLVSIKAFTQLLPERYQDGEFRATFFDLIGQEVTRIDGLVNRLLDFARPTKPSLESTELHELLDDCLHLVGEQMRSQSIQIVRSFAPGTETLRGDADLLKQAFVNFLLNAIQCMEDGGELTVVTSAVESGRNHLPRRGRKDGNGIIVSFRDTGPGIPPEDMSRVFDPFFTTKSAGTGLGLAVAHGILEEHGAVITVGDNDPVGTRFDILFPLPATRRGPA